MVLTPNTKTLAGDCDAILRRSLVGAQRCNDVVAAPAESSHESDTVKEKRGFYVG